MFLVEPDMYWIHQNPVSVMTPVVFTNRLVDTVAVFLGPAAWHMTGASGRDRGWVRNRDERRHPVRTKCPWVGEVAGRYLS